MSKTTTVNFAESTSQSRQQTITIPKSKSVVKVTPNTGTATYSINGENVTINVSGGAYTRYTTSSYTPSKSASSSTTSSSSSHSSTKSYNDGTYSGTLSYTGTTSRVVSGTPGGSKTVSDTRSSSSGGESSTCADAKSSAVAGLSSSISYNDGTYSGTLSRTSTSSSCTYHSDGGSGQDPYYTGSATGTYSGTVTKPDTQVYEYTHNYSGTVYAATQTTYTYYYAYSVVVEYIDNTAPTLNVQIGAQSISNNQVILIADKNARTINFTPNDIDTGDVLKYSISLRGTIRVPLTTCTNGVTLNHTINYSDLVYGNNALTFNLEDGNGGTLTFNVILRNKKPITLCQTEVFNVVAALGYSNTNYSSLNSLKPSNYPSSSPLSLQDIIDSLT